MLLRRLFGIFSVAGAAAYGGVGCIAPADEPGGGDEEVSASLEMIQAGEASRETKEGDEQGCGLHGNMLELVRSAITKDALLVEVRFRAGSEGAVHQARSAPRVGLHRDGCAAGAPHVDGVVESKSERISSLRVALDDLPEGHIDLSFTVEGAELVLLLRKKGGEVVLETDAERYPGGNTEIGGVARSCGRIQ